MYLLFYCYYTSLFTTLLVIIHHSFINMLPSEYRGTAIGLNIIVYSKNVHQTVRKPKVCLVINHSVNVSL